MEKKKFFMFSDYPEKWLCRVRKEGFIEPYLSHIIALINPKEGEKVLEVGVGEGRHIEVIRRAGAWYTGIDISCRILRYACESLRNKINVNLLICDAEHLPFRVVFSIRRSLLLLFFLYLTNP